MNQLFPISSVTFRQMRMDGSTIKQWPAPELNMKTKVVCDACNNGWMSRLENDYAKPAMKDLIQGNRLQAIGKKRAYGLSLFAFKTAVIANRSLPEAEFFFDSVDRYTFRRSLSIPPDISMWLVGMEPFAGGGIGSFNVHFGTYLSLNICSFWVGQLGFQVVSAKSSGPQKVESLPTPPNLTIRFHPHLEPNLRWPRPKVLSVDAFHDFTNRWNAIKRR